MIRVFENHELRLSTLKRGDELYFKAKDVAKSLGYQNPKEAIIDHVPEEYKKRLGELRGRETLPPGSQPNSLYVSEPGLYSLIFRSHLPAAEKFRRWVFEEVLPSIRKTGKYEFRSTAQMFKIENEFDLHRKVVDYIRRFYPDLLFIAGLGELQDTSDKRIKSWQKGYQKGQPDLIISSHHKNYNGLCLEFKTPKGTGMLSEAQRQLLQRYAENGYNVLVSNDYDVITRAISEYCEGLRIPCNYCPNKFRTTETLHSHLDGFHRIFCLGN